MNVERERTLERQIDADGLIDGIPRGHDNQQIDVALRVRLAIGVGAKQKDSVGMKTFGNLTHQAPDRRKWDVGRTVAVRRGVGPRRSSLLGHGGIVAARGRAG
jgi:hypothetical protein